MIIFDLVRSCQYRNMYKRIFIHLICCSSYDADWKGENQCYQCRKDESPPWHLDLIFLEDAEE